MRASSAGGGGRSRRMVLPPLSAVRQAKERGMTSRNVYGREGRGEGEREGGEGSEINRNGDVSVSMDENDPIVQTATMLMNSKMLRALAAWNVDKLKDFSPEAIATLSKQLHSKDPIADAEMLLRDLKYNERVEEKERTKGRWEFTIDGVKRERQV
ncbi:uncharacterized protein MONOS_6055 [Monocercomonoides exilis]|uniref:uncharacterized protein n=1 Tax=Monocercomonoides exilis TaxID=2049356 RepID=UPI00355A362A|nr:hypothetical protein MONOS_6055 [Monocercomonoides exilis]